MSKTAPNRVPAQFDLYIIRLRHLNAALEAVGESPKTSHQRKLGPDDVTLECYLGKRKRFVAKLDPTLIDDNKVIFDRHQTVPCNLKRKNQELPEEFEEKKLKFVLKIWKKKAATFRLNAASYYQAAPTRDPISLITESKKKSKSPHSNDADRTKLPVLLLKFEDLALREPPEVSIGGITAAAPVSAAAALTGSQAKNTPLSPHAEPASSKPKKKIIGRLFAGNSKSADDDLSDEERSHSPHKLVERSRTVHHSPAASPIPPPAKKVPEDSHILLDDDNFVFKGSDTSSHQQEPLDPKAALRAKIHQASLEIMDVSPEDSPRAVIFSIEGGTRVTNAESEKPPERPDDAYEGRSSTASKKDAKKMLFEASKPVQKADSLSNLPNLPPRASMSPEQIAGITSVSVSAATPSHENTPLLQRPGDAEKSERRSKGFFSRLCCCFG